MKILNVFGLATALSCCAVVATNEPSSELQKNVDVTTNNSGRICSNDIKVIDGDTIELGGKRIRLICVDTPESYYQGKKQYCLDNETDCGKLAKEAMEAIISKNMETSGKICCSWGKKDRYKRYLGWCDNGGTESVTFDKTINYRLITLGFAWFYDGGKECAVFKEPFLETQRARRGLFNDTLGGFKEPRLWRKTKSNN